MIGRVLVGLAALAWGASAVAQDVQPTEEQVEQAMADAAASPCLDCGDNEEAEAPPLWSEAQVYAECGYEGSSDMDEDGMTCEHGDWDLGLGRYVEACWTRFDFVCEGGEFPYDRMPFCYEPFDFVCDNTFVLEVPPEPAPEPTPEQGDSPDVG